MSSYRELVAYIAGIIDGEGYIGMTKTQGKKGRITQTPGYALQVTVGMTNLEPIKLLNSLFKGNIRIQRAKNPQTKALWTWNADSRGCCLDTLTTIQPYLLVKSEQAALAITYLASIAHNERDTELRAAFYEKFKQLNKTGVPEND